MSIALMVTIFWFSSRDATASTEQSDFFITVFLRGLFDGEIPHWLSVLVRKAAHFTVYAALGFCLLFSFDGAVSVRRAAVYALCIAVAYAVTDEIHQIFVPG
ncbi:MAG: VanZ family protein, partial [Clostridia bacterium]|nr:VanZ family protein [Clostridia bacterium]